MQDNSASDAPQSKNADPEVAARQLSADGKKPIESVLHQCRRAFYFAFGVTAIIDILGVIPMLYMMNVMDRAISAKSGATLISLTILVIAVYIFWSAIEWIRSRLLVRLSLRIDWDLSSDIFDASFRRYVGRKNVNVHQLLGDLTTLRQFLTGQGILTLMDAPFGIIFIIIGALFHPYQIGRSTRLNSSHSAKSRMPSSAILNCMKTLFQISMKRSPSSSGLPGGPPGIWGPWS